MVNRRNILMWWVLALLCALGLSACGGPYTFRGDLNEDLRAAPDFVLADARDQPFRLSDQHGKVVLLFFGYTSCPDVCPTALSDLAAVARKLGAEASLIQVAFISIDPERDTPERLQRYVTAFNPSFIGLRGSPQELQPILKAYRVKVVRTELPGSALGYAMDHSAFIYVIDQAGRWRERFNPMHTVDDIVSDLRYLMRNGSA